MNFAEILKFQKIHIRVIVHFQLCFDQVSFRTTNPYIQFGFRLRILEPSKLFQKIWIFTVINKPYILHFRTESSVQIIISKIPATKIQAISLVSPIQRSWKSVRRAYTRKIYAGNFVFSFVWEIWHVTAKSCNSRF